MAGGVPTGPGQRRGRSGVHRGYGVFGAWPSSSASPLHSAWGLCRLHLPRRARHAAQFGRPLISGTICMVALLFSIIMVGLEAEPSSRAPRRGSGTALRVPGFREKGIWLSYEGDWSGKRKRPGLRVLPSVPALGLPLEPELSPMNLYGWLTYCSACSPVLSGRASLNVPVAQSQAVSSNNSNF